MRCSRWLSAATLATVALTGSAASAQPDPAPPPAPDPPPEPAPPEPAPPEAPAAPEPAAPEPAPPPPAEPAPEPASAPPQDPATKPAATGDQGMKPMPMPPAKKSAEPEPSGNFYTNYFDRKLEELLSLPLWGNTTQLPAGVFKIRYEVNPARADSFYNGDGDKEPLLPRIEVNDIPDPGDVLIIKPDVEGTGVGHTFQFGYGISDPVDVFVELPFTKISSDLRLDADLNGQPISQIERAGVLAAIENNGRPAPNEKYRGSLDLGDMIVGGAWNYKRTDHFSAATVGRLFLPTGHRADPNNDFTFLLGPELDRGIGAWALNTTQVFDVRPGGADFPWVVFNFEVTTGYTFGYEREAPKWLPVMNCRRIPNGTPERTQLCSGPAFPPFDPTDETGDILPDLEDMSSTYKVEPAMNLDALAGVTIEPGIPIPIQVGYQFQRNEAVTVRPADPDNDADHRFVALTRELELFAASELHTVGVGTNLPLFPLYIPAAVTLSARFAVAGKNTIILERNYSVAFELFLPVGDAWMEPRKPSVEN